MEKIAKSGGENFGGKSVFFSIVKLALPSVVAMMVVSLYSVCDTFFLSAVGETAVGGICFPVVAIMQGVVMTFAFGSANKISASLGKNDEGGASDYFSSGLISNVVVCVILGGLIFAFASPLAKFCGGGGKPASGYLGVSGISMLFFGVYFYYSACLRGCGKASVVMVASVLGLVINCVLDFFAVKVFSFGALGVAVATGVAQIVAGGFMVVYCLFEVDILKPKLYAFDFYYAKEIIFLGSSSFFRQLMCGVSAIALNYVCVRIGGETLAGCTIASKISVLVFAFGLGVAQGMQPVVAFYFGGGDKEKARIGIVVGVLLAVSVGVIMGAVQGVFADNISKLFAFKNEESGVISAAILKVTAFSTPFSFLLVAINMAFQAVGLKFCNILISTLRQGVIFVPALLLLANYLGEKGVVWSHFASDVIAGVISIFFLGWLIFGGFLSKTQK